MKRSKKIKYFFDTEFLEDGKTIELISIAIVSEDNREYYACVIDADWDRILKDKWLQDNVICHLPQEDSPVWKTRKQIAKDIIEFVGKNPEFWADYASYDWVVLCQLYGKMLDLPKTWPMFVRDIQQWRKQEGIEKFILPTTGNKHDALADARECKGKYEYIQGILYRGS